jgi:hypothetical protein
MWKNGITIRYRDSPRVFERYMNASVCTTLAKMLRCVSIALFGAPVVPPVYCSTATSSGSIGVQKISGTATEAMAWARVVVPSTRGGAAPGPEYSSTDVMMMRSSGVTVRRSSASDANVSSVMNTRRPASAAMV